ncbi:diaminopimelate epimerase [Polymorphobacter multimanifer]|uniref:Diaminopimelate epimerase n=1 Tax=Polymorphobacter multimanifer TaxID=1070431 RepID=A0A841L423_9SPHN|nr:diaminopimelate epimerase [Polymorphobacter multimanifer]MBB6227407.1 diaminopimelate epimerase [Polymorphobacter multimanifer]
MTKFLKMHGLGNDFMLLDAREHPVALTAQQVRNLADRCTGVGFDQLILVEPSETASVKARFWNPDGSEVPSCGNGSRALAVYLGGAASIETAGGPLTSAASGSQAEIDMGPPRWHWEQTLAYPLDTLHLPVSWDELTDPAALSVGNPHIVFEVSDPAAIPLESLGPRIETDPLFPAGINVGIARVDALDRITLRVWERGAGLTRACGTGAVAAVAALQKRGRIGAEVTVTMPGGEVRVRRDESGHLHLAGPAIISFTGEIDLEAFA